MPVSQQQHWEYTLAEWNRQEFLELMDKIGHIETFIDIGANAGGVTHVFLTRYPNLKAYCFEPDPENFRFLTEKLEDRAKCYEKGIYYGIKTGKLMARGDSNVGGYFLADIQAGYPEVDMNKTVQLQTLEELGFTPDLIKMDVEGAEVNILEHSQVVKNTPYLIVEWHPQTSFEQFAEKHLPQHIIIAQADTNHLLCLKSQLSL